MLSIVCKPKLAMALRRSNSNDAKALAKTFRSHFHSVETGTFQPDIEDCLQRHMDFFLDLWELGMYPAESAIANALKLVWPEKATAEAKQIAKSLKGVLGTIHYKRRRMSSGGKSAPLLKEFLAKVDAPALPISSSRVEPTKTDKSHPSKTEQSEPSSHKTPKQKPSRSTNLPIDKDCKVIASLYGVANHQVPTLSPYIISDSDVNFSQEPSTATPQGEACKGFYFDHEACCLVRTVNGTAGVEIEKSTMMPGKGGFAEAVFQDGQVKETEIPNLELFPTGLKRPASALKKPAACEETLEASTDSEPEVAEVSSQDSLPNDGPHKLAKASSSRSNQMVLASGVILKLGKFSAQSYITFKEPGSIKFHLLVACSAKQAARNGKHHHQIISSIWTAISSKGVLPSKGDCKVQVLDLLK